ncbi:MAG TPA: glutamate formimidoyltransferase [Methylomirabilota bacterium]|nr:glutamate formimidoyltransferase [Methylomirabilota bacterium]
MTRALVECVPNVSEGRDRARVEAFAAAVRATPAVTLLDVHADPDHHRAVYSFAGAPPAVEAGALALATCVIDALDLRTHSGVHPRIGALDVVPFVPLAGCTMAEAVALARRVGRAVAARHGLPVYYYGHAATRPGRRRLPDVRRGGYEALPTRLASGDDPPDDGPPRFDPRSGAVLVAARELLVAFNVWLGSSDLEAARAIARRVRESGGGLPAVQALGLPLPSRGLVQVSMNLLDFRVTPIPAAFDLVCEEAARRSIGVRQSELVGVAPRAAFAGRSPESVGLAAFRPSLLLDTFVAPSG